MREKIITLGMYSFLRCFRLGMVMTRLCPHTTGNPCGLVHNTLKCVGPIYIDHLLLLRSVVTDINYSHPPQKKSGMLLNYIPILSFSSVLQRQNSQHFFMQRLFSLKNCTKTKCTVLLMSVTRPLQGIAF
jgi:hypothetical protein